MVKPIVNKGKKIKKPLTRRMIMLLGLQMAGIGVLGWRIRTLQLEDTDRYRLRAEKNRVNIRMLPPIRGVIFDQDGIILATNQQNYKLVIIREEAKDPQKVLSDLSKLIDLSTKRRLTINKEINKNRAFVPVTVAENLSWTEFARVAVNLPSLPGLIPEVGFSRYYLKDKIMAHMVGYVGPIAKSDLERLPSKNPLFQIPKLHIGKTGVERQLDFELRGSAGVSRLEVNAFGRVMRELERDNAVMGKDIQLTVNSQLQHFAMERMKGLSASAVILDVNSGNILSMCSTPSFNPNKIVQGISSKDWKELLDNKKRPLSNKSVSDAYPPASTFKMIVAIAALESGIISSEDEVTCEGLYEIGDSKHHCWLSKGHGRMNLIRGLKRSCDIYFYEIARRVGIDRIANTATKFGIGEKISLPVSAISKGLMPTKNWKLDTYGQRWLIGDTLNAGIGQGYLLVTPLQLAVMTARIATGKSVKPRLINAINGVQNLTQKPEKLDISSEILNEIQKGMFSVVNDFDGTAFKSRTNEQAFSFAGKTGTAQVRRITSVEREQGVTKNEDLPWNKRDHALFTGYAPYENPRYAISVVVEHGGGGSTVAAPIARDILLFAKYGRLPPLSAYPTDQRREVESKFRDLNIDNFKNLHSPRNIIETTSETQT